MLTAFPELDRRVFDAIRQDSVWLEHFERGEEPGKRVSKQIVRRAKASAIAAWPHGFQGWEIWYRERDDAVVSRKAIYCGLVIRGHRCTSPVKWPRSKWCSERHRKLSRRKPWRPLSDYESALLTGMVPIDAHELEIQQARADARCECEHYFVTAEARAAFLEDRRRFGLQHEGKSLITYTYRPKEEDHLVCAKCSRRLPENYAPDVARVSATVPGRTVWSVDVEGDSEPWPEERLAITAAAEIQTYEQAGEPLVVEFDELADAGFTIEGE